MTKQIEMRPVSLLLISDSYPPVLGGSETEAQRVCAEMIRRGHRVLVLTSGGSPMPPVRDWVDPAGVPVRILTRNARGRWKDTVFACRVAWVLWRERRNYQIVYFLMQGLHLAAGLPVARALKKPIVMKVAGSGVISVLRSSRIGRVELGWLRRWAARLLILNEGMMQEAMEYGFPRDQMLWMPNPVDTEQFRPGQPDEIADLRAGFRIPPEALVAVYVGRLSDEKGLPSMLSGFALAAREEPRAMLVLVGDGAMRSELEAMAAKLGLGSSQVLFSGRVDVSEVPLWLQASDVFTLMSPSEGFSCALAEAMSAGLASVVSRIPANVQLIEDEVHGLLAPVGDDSAMASALIRLFRDPALRGRLGQAARQRIIDNYSTDQVAERYEALFAEVLGQRG
ncbi:MAG: glycosyltransferase family 4 protein [Bryobacteraceae bacterium]|jgi:glycosyltransferase involved in cell wall biosynthesis